MINLNRILRRIAKPATPADLIINRELLLSIMQVQGLPRLNMAESLTHRCKWEMLLVSITPMNSLATSASHVNVPQFALSVSSMESIKAIKFRP